MKAEPKRPPADRGQGRKSLAGAGASPVLQLRVTPELFAKVKANGAQWARDSLEKAKPLPQVMTIKSCNITGEAK